MLGEVTDEHVPSPPRQSGVLDVFGGELEWKLLVQFTERSNGVKHLSVARRVRAAASNHVRTVWPVLTDRMSERLGAVECLPECLVQVARRSWGQNVGRPRKFEKNVARLAFDRAAAGLSGRCGSSRFSPREFLDQPRCCGFLYPLSWTPMDLTTCVSRYVGYVL